MTVQQGLALAHFIYPYVSSIGMERIELAHKHCNTMQHDFDDSEAIDFKNKKGELLMTVRHAIEEYVNFDPNNFLSTVKDVQDELDRISRTSACIGSWTAVEWSGSAQKDGDPDPRNDEKRVEITMLASGGLHIDFPNSQPSAGCLRRMTCCLGSETRCFPFSARINQETANASRDVIDEVVEVTSETRFRESKKLFPCDIPSTSISVDPIPCFTVKSDGTEVFVFTFHDDGRLSVAFGSDGPLTIIYKRNEEAKSESQVNQDETAIAIEDESEIVESNDTPREWSKIVDWAICAPDEIFGVSVFVVMASSLSILIFPILLYEALLAPSLILDRISRNAIIARNFEAAVKAFKDSGSHETWTEGLSVALMYETNVNPTRANKQFLSLLPHLESSDTAFVAILGRLSLSIDLPELVTTSDLISLIRSWGCTNLIVVNLDYVKDPHDEQADSFASVNKFLLDLATRDTCKGLTTLRLTSFTGRYTMSISTKV